MVRRIFDCGCRACDTTLPATVSFQGGSTSLPEGVAQLIISLSGGLFYAGTNGGTIYFFLPAAGNPASFLDPGFSTNYVSLGACAIASGPAEVGVCIALKRSDGTTGLFQEIPINVWNDSTSPYFAAPAANWIEGVGLTCDNPVALGYKAAGYNVAWGGQQDPNNDPRALRGSGFNNIYRYFTK